MAKPLAWAGLTGKQTLCLLQLLLGQCWLLPAHLRKSATTLVILT